MSNYLSIFQQQDLNTLLVSRAGETKLGERIQYCSIDNWQNCLETTSASFVLLGIPEDIGVRANFGVGGAATAWVSALKSLLNIQSTVQFKGEELLVLGAFNFDKWMKDSQNMNPEQLRGLVAKMDEEIYPVIQKIVSAGKTPLIVGGGHNNAFPILKGCSLAKNKRINCVNLDAHSDFREMEGRHSGNGFRYAKAQQFLHRYAMIGLHQNYNSENIIAEMVKDNDISFSFYEDIFLEKKISFEQATSNAFTHTKGDDCGIELDLDAIEKTLTSAYSPSGISVLEARQYVYAAAQNSNTCYFHIAEGASILSYGKEDKSIGKLIAYLISDFVKGKL